MSKDSHQKDDLDLLEEQIRRRPQQSGKPTTKIPLSNPEKYAQVWHETQEELDAYDSLMRKKVYIQNSYGEQGEKDFVQNGAKPTFGIFSKEYKERKYEKSSLYKNQLEFLEELEKNSDYKKLVSNRYHTWSDFDYTWENKVKVGKILLTLAILRELPLRHFYARCFVFGVTFYYLHYHWFRIGSPSAYYMNERDQRALDNYPKIKELVTKRILNKIPNPKIQESDMWYALQNPIFYHHHPKHYRYVFRTKREVPWDGTYNMPVLPYMLLNNRHHFVHSGTLESVMPQGSGKW